MVVIALRIQDEQRYRRRSVDSRQYKNKEEGTEKARRENK